MQWKSTQLAVVIDKNKDHSSRADAQGYTNKEDDQIRRRVRGAQAVVVFSVLSVTLLPASPLCHPIVKRVAFVRGAHAHMFPIPSVFGAGQPVGSLWCAAAVGDHLRWWDCIRNIDTYWKVDLDEQTFRHHTDIDRITLHQIRKMSENQLCKTQEAFFHGVIVSMNPFPKVHFQKSCAHTTRSSVPKWVSTRHFRSHSAFSRSAKWGVNLPLMKLLDRGKGPLQLLRKDHLSARQIELSALLRASVKKWQIKKWCSVIFSQFLVLLSKVTACSVCTLLRRPAGPFDFIKKTWTKRAHIDC